MRSSEEPTNVVNNVSNEHKILRAYQYSSLVLGLSFCLFFWYFDAWLNFIAPASFMVMVCISIVVARTCHSRIASVLLVISLWLAPAWCIIFSGGLHSPLLIWLTPTIFMAGVLLGSRWAILIGTLSFCFVVGISFFSETLATLTEFHADSGLDVLFVLSATSAIALITFYGYVFTRDLYNKTLEIIRSRDEVIAADQEKFDIYETMLGATQHILNNFLQKMIYFRHMAEKNNNLNQKTVEFYDQTIKETTDQIDNLKNIQNPNKENIMERYLPK